MLDCLAVIVQEPAPTIVTMFPAIVAIDVFELVYVKTPSPLVVGGVMANAASPIALVGIEKLLRTVVRALTWNGAVIAFPKKLAVLAWVAVIVDVPPPTTVITSPSMVATAVLELVYVNAPLLFEVGGVMLKGASPAAFEGNEKSVWTGTALFTWKTAVIVSELYVDVLSWVAVIVADPPPTIVTVLPSIVATSVLELVYEIAPVLLDCGATIWKELSPNVFAGTAKVLSPAAPLPTVRVAVVVPAVKFAVLGKFAVMVAVPTPTIVTIFFAMVATVGSELVYVNEPLLFVVGATKTNGAFPNTFSGTVKLESVAVVLFTTRVAVVVPTVLFGVLACTAVMIEKPTPTMVTVFPTMVATNVLELV